MKFPKLVFVSFIALIFSTYNSFAQHKTHEGVLDNIELSIKALDVEGKDLSKKLKMIKIHDKTWTEYNHEGKEIGKAKIVHNKHNEIKVVWTSASNGAKVDASTMYKIVKEGSSYTFHIYFNDKEQGHFNAVSE
jgi:hypothetical protein